MIEGLQSLTTDDSLTIVGGEVKSYEASYNEIATPLTVTDTWKSATSLLLKRQFIS